MSLVALVPLLALLVDLGTGVWVYLDDTAQRERGTPVEFSYGSFRLDTPADWAVACMFFWVILLPLYLVGRRN